MVEISEEQLKELLDRSEQLLNETLPNAGKMFGVDFGNTNTLGILIREIKSNLIRN